MLELEPSDGDLHRNLESLILASFGNTTHLDGDGRLSGMYVRTVAFQRPLKCVSPTKCAHEYPPFTLRSAECVYCPTLLILVEIH